MKCGAEPYEGSRPFIFVSYCHKDRAQVYPYIEMLARDGYRIWYDEGITPGDEWTENIARHLKGCSVFVAFVTKTSMNSHNCRREINYAVMRDKNMVALFLEDIKLSAGMEMMLSGRQAIFRNRHTLTEDFMDKLKKAEGMDSCRGDKRPEIQVVDRIGIDEKTVALTQDSEFIRDLNRETFLLHVASQQKVHISKSNFGIGRSDAQSDYVIPGEPSISRRHMTVRKKGNFYFVVDNDSVNHVWINGNMIEPGNENEISSFDIISLAKEQMIFFRNYCEDDLAQVQTLVLKDEDGSEHIIEKRPVIRIGSKALDRNGHGNEICISGDSVKDYHAVIISTAGGIYLADISGAGHTAVNGKRLDYCKKTLLKKDLEVSIGHRSFRVEVTV